MYLVASVRPSVRLSVRRSVRLSVCMSARLYVRPLTAEPYGLGFAECSKEQQPPLPV